MKIEDMTSKELEELSISKYKDSSRWYSDSPNRRNLLLEANYLATLALVRKGEYVDEFGL